MTTWRYIAQRALTGEFLDWELPLERDELRWDLSGPGSLRGTVTPDVGRLRAADGTLLLQEWGTFLFAEADGQIRWGGIVISSGFNGDTWSVEAAGFSSYPHGIPYSGVFSRIDMDPLTAVREMWANVQAHPDGNLGVTVTGTASTPIRLGTPGVVGRSARVAHVAVAAKPARAAVTERRDAHGVIIRVARPAVPAQPYKPATPAITAIEAVTPEPYLLAWYNGDDCGSALDSLAQETPFDYVEGHAWTGTANDISHTVQIGYPRLGRRRTDLSFIQGDNVTEVVTPSIDGDDFANEVVGLGAGEGTKTLRRTVAVRDGRLRRTAVYTAKDVNRANHLDTQIRADMARRRGLLEVSSITIRNHPNAVIGSWALGDDILVDAEIPWLGRIQVWSRITAWALMTEDTAVLTLARTDSFTYGG